MPTLYDRALKFASDAHNNQSRKYTGVPYIEHPISVSSIVKSVDHTEEMLAAALLHDVVEDTEISIRTIRSFFGDIVGDLVESLTDISKPEDGNRATRKKIDALHYAKGSPQAQTIKIADLIDNTADIAKNDPNFWQVYKQEKKFVLDLLVDADPVLRNRAEKQLKELW